MSENNFDTLTAMGIENVHDIEQYSTRIEGDVDILKIYFRRHHGEWFAKSKKFKIQRLHKNVKVDAGRVPYRAITESSPYFLRAVAELDQLVAQEKSTLNRKELLLEELDHLEKVVSRKIEDLKRQIDEL
ncbi:DUF3461 family protein [Marinobacterium rhizophilum]|uniref:DUF3461 family protein n=1 Tax=Marinobacterium rhizophilum TaxID=420402 RepID=UPI00036C2CE1|nr:DUF3461 family protein [Marinobacterium rhizophilum]